MVDNIDTVMIIVCIIGVVLSLGYVGLIFWTSKKDYGKKKDKDNE